MRASAKEVAVGADGRAHVAASTDGACGETFQVGDLTACRIINGMWQTSGGGWGHASAEERVQAMVEHSNAGFTTFDMADHYGPAEDLYGSFLAELRRQGAEQQLEAVLGFTKWVPRPGVMSRDVVDENIARALSRMGVEALDMMQFHWWDYNNNQYLSALRHMQQLKREGTIRSVALTNFDTQRVQIMLDEGLEIDANQVQYSLVDQRPAAKMAPLCAAHGIKLLTYGTLLGGLLSDAWLGKPDPGRSLPTPSQGKYYGVIQQWGGWRLFQDLLAACRAVADKHGVSIANVATRAVLDRPAVGAVIVGVRLGLTSHVADNRRVFALRLDDHDREVIAAVTARGASLMQVIGDCGDEYRGGR